MSPPKREKVMKVSDAQAPATEIETRSAEEVVRERIEHADHKHEHTTEQFAKAMQLREDSRPRELERLCRLIREETQCATERLRVKWQVDDGESQAFIGGVFEEVVSHYSQQPHWRGRRYDLESDQRVIWLVSTLHQPARAVYMTADGEFVQKQKLFDRSRNVIVWEHSDDGGYSFVIVKLERLLGLSNGHIEARLADARRVLDGLRLVGLPSLPTDS